MVKVGHMTLDLVDSPSAERSEIHGRVAGMARQFLERDLEARP